MRTILALLLSVMLVIGLVAVLMFAVLAWPGSTADADAPQPEPTNPAPAPAPAPKPKRIRLLLFTQKGCPPCEMLKKMLADEALRETVARFEIQEIKREGYIWYLAKEYKIDATPALVALTTAGPKRMPRETHTLGQLANWLDDVGKVHDVAEAIVGAPREGGPIGPDGEQVVCDLPTELRAKNVGGRDGLGLCVFTSIMHAARYQNERLLWELQNLMRSEPGGGWPGKVDAMLAKHGKGARYVQYEGRDPSILELALKTGRMPGVTYNGFDIHYHGPIAHMVNLVFLDSAAACILDNNFIGEDQLVWMSRDEFLQRWTGGRSGWAVILLAGRPAPVPHN